jgi:hypothetical protein
MGARVVFLIDRLWRRRERHGLRRPSEPVVPTLRGWPVAPPPRRR